MISGAFYRGLVTIRRWLWAVCLLGSMLGASVPAATASELRFARCLLPQERCSLRQRQDFVLPRPRLRPLSSPVCRARPSLLRHGPDRFRVALTFDDGPSPYTGQLLRELRRLRVRATFFLVGNMIPGRQALVRQMRRDGHALGNHSWSHPLLSSLSRSQIRRELAHTQQMIAWASGGYRPCLFRPPYGVWNGEVVRRARARHLEVVLWNIDTNDWARPGTARIIDLALNGPRRGAIILMHDGGGDRRQTLAAVPVIVRALRRRGLGLVTVPELIGLRSRR